MNCKGYEIEKRPASLPLPPCGIDAEGRRWSKTLGLRKQALSFCRRGVLLVMSFSQVMGFLGDEAPSCPSPLAGEEAKPWVCASKPLGFAGEGFSW